MTDSQPAPTPYRIKFIADAAFVKEVKAAAEKNPADIRIESEREEKDATRLGFTLETATAVVALVTGAIEIGKFAKAIYDWFKNSKSNVVVLQTPFGTLEMHKSAGVTEEDVRKFLAAALRMAK